MRGKLFARWPLFGRVRRQQEPRFQKGEPGRHHKVIRRQFKPQRLGLFHEGQILPRQLKHRNLAQINLLRAAQRQQQIKRAFKAIDIDNQRLGGQPFGHLARLVHVAKLVLSHPLARL